MSHMNQKKLCIILSVILGGIPLGTSAENEFIPGSSLINEDEIIRRIEQEIGIRKQVIPVSTTAQKPVSDRQLTFQIESKEGVSSLSPKSIPPTFIVSVQSVNKRFESRGMQRFEILNWKRQTIAKQSLYFPNLVRIQMEGGSVTEGICMCRDFLRLNGVSTKTSYFSKDSSDEILTKEIIPNFVFYSIVREAEPRETVHNEAPQ